ncbi:hypothetical protein RU639_001861 [Aspergillus parasiticus]
MRLLTLTRAAGLNWLKSRFVDLTLRHRIPERAELSETLQKMKAEFPATIPNRINGLEIKTKQSRSQVNPSRHKDIVANYALATSDQLNTVVDAVLKAKPAREATPFEDRAAIFLRACELVAGKYRSEMVAATMLGQGKNIWQAEIDALYASWFLHKILLEAGLPEDVIQFLPGDAEEVTNTTLKRPEFSALTFIGSTATFKSLQKKVRSGIGQGIYNSYPRVVGETGGKNWGVVHSSADVSSAALNIPRAAFEYQGQKCSAKTPVYGLTGSIYAKDPYASRQAQTALKHAAGMLYLNTKCTGSTVAQQPFDGSRDSGTNDKTGTMAHLQRFVSTRTIKEKFVPLKNLGYPSNEV